MPADVPFSQEMPAEAYFGAAGTHVPQDQEHMQTQTSVWEYYGKKRSSGGPTELPDNSDDIYELP